MTDPDAGDAAATPPARDSRLLIGAIVVLTLLSVAPFWLLPYIPTTDGPSHLEASWILGHWSSTPEAIRQTYQLNFDLFPNWVSHAVLAGLMFVVTPVTAERILLTGYVLIWVLSIGYFLRSVHPRGTLHLLLSLPLIHCYPLYMGFYNYMMSVPLAFLMIGFWWRRRSRPLHLRLVLALNALAVAVYFFHLASVLVALGSILLLAAIRDRGQPRRVLALAAALAPSVVLPAYYLLSHWGSSGATMSTGTRWTDLFGISILFSFNRFSLVLGWTLAGILGALAVATVFRENLALRAPAGRRRLRTRPEDAFALLAAVFAVGWFLIPDSLAGGSYLLDRVGLYPVIALLPWLTVRLGARWRTGVVVLAGAITVAQVAIPYPKQLAAARGVGDYVAGTTHIEPGDTVLPISFFSHVGQPRTRISTYLHAVGYYTLAGGVGLFNYEATTDYFPIRYRAERNPSRWLGAVQGIAAEVTPWRSPEPVDWVVIRYPGRHLKHWPLVVQWAPIVNWLLAHYEAVYHRGEVWLLRRKPGAWPPPPPAASTAAGT